MNHTRVMKSVLLENEVKQSDLVKQLGLSSAVISSRINHENISVKAFLEMLDVLGYELVVRKLNDEYKRGEYPIRLADYQE